MPPVMLESQILVPARLLSLSERLLNAEATANRLVVKTIVQTALTKGVRAEQRAVEQQAAAGFTSQLKQQQAQREDSMTQLKALHDAQVKQLEQECAEAQKAALKAEQAEAEAHLTQQQRTHQRDLADCRTAFTKQVKEQLRILTAQHEGSTSALCAQHSSAFNTYQAQMESEKQRYVAERQQLKQQLADLQGDLQTERNKGLEVCTLTSSLTADRVQPPCFGLNRCQTSCLVHLEQCPLQCTQLEKACLACLRLVHCSWRHLCCTF